MKVSMIKPGLIFTCKEEEKETLAKYNNTKKLKTNQNKRKETSFVCIYSVFSLSIAVQTTVHKKFINNSQCFVHKNQMKFPSH